MADVEFDRLIKYHKTVTRYIETEAINFRQEVEASTKAQGFNEEQAEHYYDSHLEEFEIWSNSFPNTVCTSVLITACSLLESGLTDICKHLERELKSIRLKWTDIERETGIRRARSFCKRTQLFILKITRTIKEY